MSRRVRGTHGRYAFVEELFYLRPWALHSQGSHTPYSEVSSYRTEPPYTNPTFSARPSVLACASLSPRRPGSAFVDYANYTPPLNGLPIQLVHLLGRSGHTILPLYTCPIATHGIGCTNGTAPVSHPHVFAALRSMCKADGNEHDVRVLPISAAVPVPHGIRRVLAISKSDNEIASLLPYVPPPALIAGSTYWVLESVDMSAPTSIPGTLTCGGPVLHPPGPAY